jgi:hypothetical protein
MKLKRNQVFWKLRGYRLQMNCLDNEMHLPLKGSAH